MDKIDARRLTPEGREQLRRMVIRLRQQSGMSCTELAKIAGVHVRTAEIWIRRAAAEGTESLGERARGRPSGTGRKLSLAQEVWLQEQMVERLPGQLSLPFALWTRPAIKALIHKQFGIEVQDRLIGKYLARWRFTPQRPVKRALEQNPEAVRAWLQETYPQIAQRARKEGATIYWADETAVKEDSNWVRGYAPVGKTPVLTLSARWPKLSMVSAITNRGDIAFQIVHGTINTERFIEFLQHLLEQDGGKVFLIVDNLRVHHAKLVTEWVKAQNGQIELFFLPPYAPESNPDEYLNNDFKTALRSGAPSTDNDSLMKKALAFMEALPSMPARIMSYFRHPAVVYAA